MNTSADRATTLQEIARILRPGGRLALIDFIFTEECVEMLRQTGLLDARRVRLGGLSFWSGSRRLDAWHVPTPRRNSHEAVDCSQEFSAHRGLRQPWLSGPSRGQILFWEWRSRGGRPECTMMLSVKIVDYGVSVRLERE